MDELGELACDDERTLADEMLGRDFFNEPFWPAGAPPTDEAARRAVVASWVARIRGEPTATPPARDFRVACGEKLAAYAALTEEAALGVHVLPQCVDRLTEEERCAVMAALAGRLPSLQRLDASDAQLCAMVPVWREMAASGRPAGLNHVTVLDGDPPAPGAPAAPLPPPLGPLLPRLQSLSLCVYTPDHQAGWCAMLADSEAPSLASLVFPVRHDVADDEQAALYVRVLRRQGGSLRTLSIQPYGLSAGAAEALDAAIVALPHLVNLRTSPVAVRGSLRVLGGRAPRLRSVTVTCFYGIDSAAGLTAWARELSPSVERIGMDVHPRLQGLAALPWRDLAAVLRALGARPALRKLSLSVDGGDGLEWLQSVLSPSPDVVAAPVWPHVEELECSKFGDGVQLDLRHFPRLRKFDGTLLDAASVSTVMRSAACRDVNLNSTPFVLTAADAGALPPKQRLVGSLSGATAEETVAALAGVVGGWADLRVLQLSAGRDLEVSEATQVALARALGRCAHLRELRLPFPLCPAAAAVLAAALPHLPDVTLVSVCGITTTSLLALVRGLPGMGGGASDPARTLRAVVRGAGDAAATTDDLRELGASAVVAARRGWVLHFVGQEGLAPALLVALLQALALRRDWRDCIVPLCVMDVERTGLVLQLCPRGLVGWTQGELADAWCRQCGRIIPSHRTLPRALCPCSPTAVAWAAPVTTGQCGGCGHRAGAGGGGCVGLDGRVGVDAAAGGRGGMRDGAVIGGGGGDGRSASPSRRPAHAAVLPLPPLATAPAATTHLPVVGGRPRSNAASAALSITPAAAATVAMERLGRAGEGGGGGRMKAGSLAMAARGPRTPASRYRRKRDPSCARGCLRCVTR
jgi:hypothetical protein